MSKIQLLTMSRVYLLVIFTVSIVTASAYITYNPIDFHCDSATFYNYGSQISLIFKKIFFIASFLLIFFFYFNKKLKIKKKSLF